MQDISILLVEDNRDDEELALWALRKGGLTNVACARDGLEAVTMLQGDPEHGVRESCFPDLVLLDLRLPRIDGIDVLKRLRIDERTKRLKIIVLTSSEDPNDQRICSDLGVLAVLSKPLDEKVLARYL